ncbi:cation diffusion facilitator family transporter [Leptobacterium sp. I13]|uniref:cation diffusion facilitator family transporter n=1 Tax=Leptobacterium meishanense TaxID=3128904 RepID=UPI0030EC34C9
MGHSSHHNHSHHQKIEGKNLFISIVLNIVITASQVIGGILSGSLALLSDALHNFSDVLSLVVSYFANRLSKKEASTNRTFGYKRAEIIAAFTNAATLIIVAVLLIIEAIKRFSHPEEITSNLVIWLASLGIVANGISVLLLKKEAGKNMNMKSAYLHLLTDMLASVAVLIGGLLMKFFAVFWVDSVLTLGIAFYLIYVGYDLLKESLNILMLFTPTHINIDMIVDKVNGIKGVKHMHHVHVWQLNEEELHLEAHIDFEEDIRLSEFDAVLNEIEKKLCNEFHINHINIQPEYKKEDPKDIIVQD